MSLALKSPPPSLSDDLVSRLQHCTNLPSPPGVAARIIELGQDPTVHLGMVAEVVGIDPSLTAKILRMANSPLYARQRKTENLRQAIMMFGLNGTLTLALSFSLVSTLRTKQGTGLDHNLFWRRCLATASCCRALGARLGIAAKDDFFLAGLLQDIGMLALDRVDPQLYRELQVDQTNHAQVYAAEFDKLGTDHAAVGGWLLERWNLPSKLTQAAAGSHFQATQVDEENRVLVSCVAVSAATADIWCGEDHEQAAAEAALQAEKLLDVDRETLAAVVDVVGRELQETAALFDVDLGDTTYLELISDQAKEILMLRNLQTMNEAAGLKRKAESLESRTQELEETTRRDDLTGLYNRNHLDEAIETEFHNARAHQSPVAVVFVDLDHFKNINDTHGHQAGDEVLRGAAGLLRASTRDTDFVARYGGEEFVVLLPDTGKQGACITAERIVAAFRAASHDVGQGTSIEVTVSAGLAVQGEGAGFATAAALLRAADEAVYIAKQQGRNRWVANESELEGAA